MSQQNSQRDMHGNPILGFTAENVKTKSGDHVVFHRDRCPFAQQEPRVNVPADFVDQPGPWFFMKTEGCKTALNYLRGYPIIYSPGYASPEEALAQAEEWEPKLAALKTYQEGVEKKLFNFDE